MPNAKCCDAMETAVADGAMRAASDWLSGFAKIKPVAGQSPLRYAVTPNAKRQRQTPLNAVLGRGLGSRNG
jgi:hypothetical protein